MLLGGLDEAGEGGVCDCSGGGRSSGNVGVDGVEGGGGAGGGN